MTDIKSKIQSIAARVPDLLEEHARAGAANAHLRAAEVELLEHTIEIVKPAVDVVGTRCEQTRAWKVGGEAEHPPVFFGKRAINLCGGDFGPRSARLGHDPFGAYGGVAIALTADGELHRVAYEGEWHTEKGRRCSWKSTMRPITVQDVFKDIKLEVAIGAMADAILGAGDRSKAVAHMRDRSEKLRAILVLLQGH